MCCKIGQSISSAPSPILMSYTIVVHSLQDCVSMKKVSVY